MTSNEQIKFLHMANRGVSNLTSAEQIVPYLLQYVNPKNVIDFGCAVGVWLLQFKKRGIKVHGIDGEWVRKYKKYISEDDIQYFDFESDNKLLFEEKYDLALCLEMAEHISSKKADKLIDTLTQSSDVIYFSAATPNSGGQHHVNEQWQSFWKKKFMRRGFVLIDCIRPHVWHNKQVCYFYAQESFIYVKEDKLEKYPLLKKIYEEQHNCIIDIVHPELFSNQIAKPTHEWSYLFSLLRQVLYSMLRKILKKY